MTQVIKYKWEGWKPVFTAVNNGSFEKIMPLNREINLSVGKKTCIGFMAGSKHVACPNSEEVSDNWHCPSCLRDDYFFMCVKCDGSDCKNTKRREECKKEKYYIYLSAFGPVMKVGISNQFRLINRLVEQGADIAARIALVHDGKEARLVEQEIKKCLDIEDRIEGTKKHGIMFWDPNVAIVNILSAIERLRAAGFGLIEPEIYDLRRFYNLDKVLEVPVFSRIKEGDEISGKIIAAKGNILVAQNNETFFSFNAHDIIGRSVSIVS